MKGVVVQRLKSLKRKPDCQMAGYSDHGVGGHSYAEKKEGNDLVIDKRDGSSRASESMHVCGPQPIWFSPI